MHNPSEKKTVIALDDSEIVLEVLKLVLEAEGFAVLTALTLGQLEIHLEKGRPDLVVLDVQMPEAFGDDVGRVLAQVRGIDAPIVLFSSLAKSDLAARVRDAALTGFVSKDEGIDALVVRICELLRGAEG